MQVLSGWSHVSLFVFLTAILGHFVKHVLASWLEFENIVDTERLFSVTSQRSPCSSFFLLNWVEVDLLGQLKVSIHDKVQTICLRDFLLVHFLSTNELLQLHILKNALEDVCSKLFKHCETPEESDYFFEPPSFFLPDGPDVIFPVQNGKFSCLWALDRGGTPFVLQEGKLAKATALWKPCHFFESVHSNGLLVLSVDKFVNL